MQNKNSASEITPDLKERLENLAQFISSETIKSDNAANASNWEIFYRYNREFNEIAKLMGYDMTADGNEDWTSVKAINTQLTSPDWYEGKSRAWLQQARRIFRVACAIYIKCIADNALDELDIRSLSYEQCRLISNSSLPLEEKKQLWQWMESTRPTCREVRVQIRERVVAHKHLGSSTQSSDIDVSESYQPASVEALEHAQMEAIAQAIISKVQSGEIAESEKLLKELARQVRKPTLKEDVSIRALEPFSDSVN